MSRRIAILVGFSLAITVPAARADSVSAEQIKQAAGRAIPALLDDRDKTIKEQVTGGGGCVSCHWSGPAIFTMGIAERRGLVDRKEVQKFDNMLKLHTTPKLVYVLNDKTIQLVKTAGLADEKVAALKKKANQQFNTANDLLKAMGKDVAPAMLDQHQAEITKLAANPYHYETGDNALGGASILMAISTSVEVAKGLIDRPVRAQQKDGSFNQTGQPFLPCGPGEQSECQTLWVAISLEKLQPRSEAANQCLERANAYLTKTKPGQSTVALMLRALWAQSRKDQPRVAEFKAAFLKQQHADGGWSSWNWTKADYESDPWATGLAVYTLAVLGHKHTDENVQRGLAFLLKTQETDGGWTVTNAKGKGARIWSYWGTSWATAGLIETLPKSDAAAVK
jgi:hypothetical protein